MPGRRWRFLAPDPWLLIPDPWNGGVAQLGEHLLCKQGVVGSSPITSTRHLPQLPPPASPYRKVERGAGTRREEPEIAAAARRARGPAGVDGQS